MRMTHWWRALAVGLLLALPASAQEAVPVPSAAPVGGLLPPDGAILAAPEAVRAAPAPPPGRPGLFGWRRRHAERKRHLQQAFIGFPEEFNEWPLGEALYSHGRTEVANGATARLIFNDYDFVGQTAELNVRGRDKLVAVAAQLPTSFAPVIIERTPWASGVDQNRRLAILSRLAAGPFPVPAERVVIGPALAQGMRGQEAVPVNLYRQGLYAGAGGGGAVGSLDGSGLSGLGGGASAGGATGR